MGYVLPTLEEWRNPSKLRARMEREARFRSTLLLIGVLGVVVALLC